jgi:hypothetical protein
VKLSNTENAKKWVAALRSGKYKQGMYGMHRLDDSHCCLGVAHLVMGDNRDPDAYGAVGTWLGIPAPESYWGGCGEFVHLNDHQRKTFAEIADYVETNCLE